FDWLRFLAMGNLSLDLDNTRAVRVPRCDRKPSKSSFKPLRVQRPIPGVSRCDIARLALGGGMEFRLDSSIPIAFGFQFPTTWRRFSRLLKVALQSTFFPLLRRNKISKWLENK